MASTTTSSSSSSAAAAATEEPRAEPGLYSLAWSKADGFPWWPAVVVDERDISNFPKVLQAKLPDHVLVMYFPLSKRFLYVEANQPTNEQERERERLLIYSSFSCLCSGWVKPELTAPFDETSTTNYLTKATKSKAQIAKAYGEAQALIEEKVDFQDLIREINDKTQPPPPKKDKTPKKERSKKDKALDAAAADADTDDDDTVATNAASSKKKHDSDDTDDDNDAPTAATAAAASPRPQRTPRTPKTPKEVAVAATASPATKKRRASDADSLEQPKAKRAKKTAAGAASAGGSSGVPLLPSALGKNFYQVGTTIEQATQIATDITLAIKQGVRIYSSLSSLFSRVSSITHTFSHWLQRAEQLPSILTCLSHLRVTIPILRVCTLYSRSPLDD